jgi:predicted CXXCH cytochrome family protein
VKTEGCVSCHTPHGSSNPRLLRRSQINLLCLECHSLTTDPGAPATSTFHNQAQKYQACTMCHIQIYCPWRALRCVEIGDHGPRYLGRTETLKNTGRGTISCWAGKGFAIQIYCGRPMWLSRSWKRGTLLTYNAAHRFGVRTLRNQ